MASEPQSQVQRVLVMDDDTQVRIVLGQVLEQIGFAAALASGGSEAMELYRRAKEEGEPFAAVIMDLTIPGGMGAEEAVQELHRIDPEARVIVTSAFQTHPVMRAFREHGFAGAVGKPFKIAQMRALLKQVLGA